jgi:hypothetical protein
MICFSDAEHPGILACMDTDRPNHLLGMKGAHQVQKVSCTPAMSDALLLEQWGP